MSTEGTDAGTGTLRELDDADESVQRRWRRLYVVYVPLGIAAAAVGAVAMGAPFLFVFAAGVVLAAGAIVGLPAVHRRVWRVRRVRAARTG